MIPWKQLKAHGSYTLLNNIYFHYVYEVKITVYKEKKGSKLYFTTGLIQINLHLHPTSCRFVILNHFTSRKAEMTLGRMWLQRMRKKYKFENREDGCKDKKKQVSRKQNTVIDAGLKFSKIVFVTKANKRKGVPESWSARRETVGVDEYTMLSDNYFDIFLKNSGIII